MPGAINFTSPAKVMLVAENGEGKTGAAASLVAAGYKVRMMDTDKGAKALITLLTRPEYPYAKYMAENNIDLEAGFNFVEVDQPMTSIGGELKPKGAIAWNKAVNLLEKWIDGTTNYGNPNTWEDDVVLMIDTWSTLSKAAYYHIQALNGRLGARDEGFDYQRDIGGAQSQLTRLLEYLNSNTIKCNVLLNTHITWVDLSRGTAERPNKPDGSNSGSIPKGYPSSIGRALSPVMGKYFNDVYSLASTGSGQSVRRLIYTTPMQGVMGKNSSVLKPAYGIESGLAEIFAALRNQDPPEALVKAIGRPAPVVPGLTPRPPLVAAASAPTLVPKPMVAPAAQ